MVIVICVLPKFYPQYLVPWTILVIVLRVIILLALLKVVYTNADQFLNKRDDLLMLIAGNEPDLILITEVMPKAHSTCMSSSRVDIPKFFRYSNFDPDAEQVVGMRGICIYVSNKLVSAEVQFSTVHSLESL